MPEESLSFYSGLLSRQTPSAVSIESAVAYYSGTSVAVEQFVERMIPLSCGGSDQSLVRQMQDWEKIRCAAVLFGTARQNFGSVLVR